MQEDKTLTIQRLKNWGKFKKAERQKFLSQTQIQKIANNLVSNWQEEHGDSEESAQLFWQTLTEKLFEQGGIEAVQKAIESLKNKNELGNAEVMENKLMELIKNN